VNSRQKGVRGELEWRDYLRARGYEAERGQQHAGGNDSPDVRHSVPGHHFEVKRQERLDIRKWYEQAVRDARAGETPVVAFRQNRGPWMVLLSADQYFDGL
jgi:Holliday junction resolvase